MENTTTKHETKPATNLPHKSWFLTLNNWTETEYKILQQLHGVTYSIIGKEGKETTPHLQGVVTFQKATRIAALKKILPRVHWEIPLNLDASRNYCMKEGDYEVTDHRHQGRRSDIAEAVGMVTDGKHMMEVAEAHPVTYVRNFRGLAALQGILERPRTWKTRVHVHWGPTGTGKTYNAHAQLKQLFPLERPYVWTPAMENWWDGYSGQSGVILDEFRGQLPFATLLNLLDEYEMIVPIKGGSRQWKPHVIFITSPLEPRSWYETGKAADSVEQLLRRIDIIEHMTEAYKISLDDIEQIYK
ncbi:putative replication initiation protein [Didemnum sp. Sea Squirt associated virus]|uniref:putative replication initiation protein n=1 Tax=Didemnum sp. Sea Squirt associated virus TaxID=1692247 RepID=UPI0006A6E259|nr:putative replication initiation protein [Didemnum sp. Sea Squirt associated virus]AKV62258.1 putative replication initiation protein [Didemnum sp. Sea Squirt associated virus]